MEMLEQRRLLAGVNYDPATRSLTLDGSDYLGRDPLSVVIDSNDFVTGTVGDESVSERLSGVEIVHVIGSPNADIIDLDPLLLMDTWEHAYYPDYAFHRRDYAVSFMEKELSFKERVMREMMTQAGTAIGANLSPPSPLRKALNDIEKEAGKVAAFNDPNHIYAWSTIQTD